MTNIFLGIAATTSAIKYSQGLNASECCATIGCNCAGTSFLEMTNIINPYILLLTVIVIILVLAILFSILRNKGCAGLP